MKGMKGTHANHKGEHLKGKGERKGAYKEGKGAYHERQDGYHERKGAYHEWKGAYHERQDAYHERQDAYHERKGAHHERQDAYHERQDAYYERQAAYNERQDAYHSYDAHATHKGEHRKGRGERKGAYHERQAAYHERQDAYHEQQAAYNEQQAAYNEQQAAYNEQQAAYHELQAAYNPLDVGSASHAWAFDPNSAAVAAVPAPLAGPFLGIVKSNDPQSSYGFIASDVTLVLFNEDVYLSREEGDGLEPGQEVYFQVRINSQGKPQAAMVSVVPTRRSFDGLALAGLGQQALAALPAVQGEANSQSSSGAEGLQSAQLQSAEWETTWFNGTVKNFNHEVGYGFIKCDDTFPLFHSDIFLHKNEADGLQVGEHVKFRIHFNAKRQPQANSVSVQGGGAKRTTTDDEPSSTREPGAGVKRAKTDVEPNFTPNFTPTFTPEPDVETFEKAAAEATSAPEPVQAPALQHPLFSDGPYTGRIKSYDSSTGEGYIECPLTKALFGHDVLLRPKQAIEGLDVGSKVSFIVRLKMLKPEADHVELLDVDEGK